MRNALMRIWHILPMWVDSDVSWSMNKQQKLQQYKPPDTGIPIKLEYKRERTKIRIVLKHYSRDSETREEARFDAI